MVRALSLETAGRKTIRAEVGKGDVGCEAFGACIRMPDILNLHLDLFLSILLFLPAVDGAVARFPDIGS